MATERASTTLADAALRLRVSLSPEMLADFARYAVALADGNQRANLTSITALDEVETLHFLDSLTVAAALPASTLQGGRLLDVGSGAGFPGVPLKIAFPGLRVTLLEATGKKAAFMEGLVDLLGLTDVDVRRGRAEDAAHDPALRASFDAVVARGVAKLPALAELTLPFLRVGGVLVAHKSGDVDAEVAAASKAVSTLGGGAPTIVPVDHPALPDGRALVVIRKSRATPSAYPRRPGMPAKHPIGA